MKRALPYILSALVFVPLAAGAQTQPTKPSQPPAPAPAPAPPPRGPGMGPGMMGPGMGHGMHGGMGGFRSGIPPQVAQKLGISPELQKKVQQLTFDANEKLISLKAELQRQQLELQKLLAQDKPNRNAVLGQVDKVSKAEGEVRKNRLGLMLSIREALGPDLWRKLQAEMPFGPRMMQGGMPDQDDD